MDSLWILFYNFDKQCVNLHFFLLSLKKKRNISSVLKKFFFYLTKNRSHICDVSVFPFVNEVS